MHLDDPWPRVLLGGTAYIGIEVIGLNDWVGVAVCSRTSLRIDSSDGSSSIWSWTPVSKSKSSWCMTNSYLDLNATNLSDNRHFGLWVNLNKLYPGDIDKIVFISSSFLFSRRESSILLRNLKSLLYAYHRMVTYKRRAFHVGLTLAGVISNFSSITAHSRILQHLKKRDWFRGIDSVCLYYESSVEIVI